MSSVLLKVASKLEEAADYIETIENVSLGEKEKEAQKIANEEKEKRARIMAPLKEKLTDIPEEELEEKMKTASTDLLELIGKSFKDDKPEIQAQDEWGNVEELKNSQGKYAGYRDPIEAFAMGD